LGSLRSSHPTLLLDNLFILSRWKALKIEWTKRRDLRQFAQVSQLHVGKRDRHIFRRMNLQIAVAVAMGGAVFAAVLFTLLDSTEAIKRLFSFKNRFAETVIFAFIPLSLSFGVFRTGACPSCSSFQAAIFGSEKTLEL
jgi:hypothetical protein